MVRVSDATRPRQGHSRVAFRAVSPSSGSLEVTSAVNRIDELILRYLLIKDEQLDCAEEGLVVICDVIGWLLRVFAILYLIFIPGVSIPKKLSALANVGPVGRFRVHRLTL